MNRQGTICQAASDTAEGPSSAASALAAALFTVFAWALSFPLTKIALADMPRLQLAAARFAIASLSIIA
jgi:hypothetical protein